MDSEKPEPKISLPEILVVGPLFFIVPDLIEIFLIFIGLDDFWIIDIYSLLTSQIYLYLKGVKPIYALIANCLELIPYAGWLPMRTLGFIITVFVDRHPKIAEPIQKAEAITGKDIKLK